MTLQRTPNGGFVLQPGYYELQTQSYCVKRERTGQATGPFLVRASERASEDLVMNRSAFDVLHGNALTDALGGVPAPLRQIAQAEAQLRQMPTTSGASSQR
jgi:hypothetical protein